MIDGYINQTAVWRPKTGNDQYGRPVYGAPTTIKCRWEDRLDLRRNSEGVAIDTVAVCYCRENVKENDQLTFNGRAHVVKSVTDQPWLNGTISHREVYM